jgi:NAD(P)-dependent dehydrogenase (short-subunit alcohol dehydrogenase family)
MSYTDKMLRDDALKGKVIVVTGGGSGLGKAMTKYFLELERCHYSRDIEKLKNTAAELETETGGTCLPIQCDVRHYEEVENMLQEVLKTFGVDVLLNNAAGNFISPTERLSANALIL